MIDWNRNARLAAVMPASMERLRSEDPTCAVSAIFSLYDFRVLVTTDMSHRDGVTRILREWLDSSGIYIPVYIDTHRIPSGLCCFTAELPWERPW